MIDGWMDGKTEHSECSRKDNGAKTGAVMGAMYV
jgi:hypothetical protein